jgi:hypothetical protein
MDTPETPDPLLRETPWWHWAVLACGVITALAGLTWVLEHFGPAVDYRYFFYPETRAWLEGHNQLYVPGSSAFYEPPWALWLIVPFAVVPYPLGLALLRAASMLILGASVVVFSPAVRGRPWILATALFNLHTFDLLWRGQIDAFLVLGIVLGWLSVKRENFWVMGLGLLLLSVKPPNTIPVALCLLAHVWQVWPRRKAAASLILPGIVGLLSLVGFPGWPVRLVAFFREAPPDNWSEGNWPWLTTLWRIRDQMELPPAFPWLIIGIVLVITVWVWLRIRSANAHDLTLRRMMLVLPMTFLVTPYALSYHYVMLLAVVMPYLGRFSMSLVAAIYLLTFTPLLRTWLGVDSAWIDIVLVVVMFAAVAMRVMQPPDEANAAGIEGVQRDPA